MSNSSGFAPFQVAAFLARFPVFKNVQPTLVASILAEATLEIDPGTWGIQTQAGIGLLAAHKLMIDPQGGDTRLVAKDGSTTYSVQYEELRSMVVVGVVVSGPRTSLGHFDQGGVPRPYDGQFQGAWPGPGPCPPGWQPWGYGPCPPGWGSGQCLPWSERPRTLRANTSTSPVMAWPGQVIVCDTSQGSVIVQLTAIGLGQQITVSQDPATSLATATVTILGPNGVNIAQPPPNNASFAASYVMSGVQSEGESLTWYNGGSQGGYLLR